VATRASIIIWSAGSGLLLGLFIDAALIGVCMVMISLAPTVGSRGLPRWASALATFVLVAVPIATAILGFLEGRLKVD
jgi:hypothetical protein